MVRRSVVVALGWLVCASLAQVALAGAPSEGATVKIGDQVRSFKFKDIRYLARTLDELGEKKAYVFVFTTLDCPVVQRYLPRLKELEEAYRDKDVQFVAINVGPEDPLREVAYQAVKADWPFHVGKDFDGDAVRALGVTRTPEVAVLDAQRTLRYRGRIDSQYRVTGVQPGEGRADLKEAIDDVLAEREVKVAETPVDGCLITFNAPPKIEPAPTFAENIAPLLQKHCQDCHRPGSTGPFPLLNYEDAVGHAEMIAEVVHEQRMPPCYASSEHGRFTNRMEIPRKDRDLLIAWALGKREMGDPAKMPEPRKFPESKWLIGEPDLVVTMPKPASLQADGYIPYKYVFLPYKFEQDTWVKGVQILPGNAESVHHCNLAAIQPGGGYADAQFITGYVPGGDPMNLDEGEGFCIKKGCVLVLQIHYVSTGEETTDQTSVGLKYCSGKIDRQIKHFQVTTGNFAITPGDSAYPVKAVRTFQNDATGIGMFSHMHLRGKDMVYIAHYPDGRSERLLAVPNYNFDWQLSYRWEVGKIKFPKGTKLEVIAHFDNSKFNPYNPDPTKTVKEGQQTFQEMMYGFVFFTEDDEKLNLVIDGSTGWVVESPAPAEQASNN